MSIKIRETEEIFNTQVTIIDWRTLIQLNGELPEIIGDFDVLDDNGTIVDYFEGFNVVYNSGDDFIQLTNDNNIYYNYLIIDENNYVKGIKTTTELSNNNFLYQYGQGKKYKEFEMVLYNEDGFPLYKIENDKVVETSIEEREVFHAEKLKELLEINKEIKINESKLLLSQYLESHPLISNCHNNIEAEYTVTTEKQSLIVSNYLTYTVAKTAGLDAKLTWNSSGQECEEWTEEEYTTLILQISEYVKPLVSLQQSYEVEIKACTNQDELDDIVINYEKGDSNE